MKYKINGGVYEVDLKGTNDSEFMGSHPSLIIESIKNKDMYYIIPLTTYTKERWEKYRKNLCCRILSSNSIARIDKIQIRHKSKIPKRWLEKNSLIIIEPTELKNVYDHAEKYFKLSIDNSINEYSKYYNNYIEFSNKCNEVFKKFNFGNNIFNINFTEKDVICTCDIKEISKLTFDDAKRIIWSIFDRSNVKMSYDKSLLYINILITDKSILTFKGEYNKMNLTEGHEDKTSC